MAQFLKLVKVLEFSCAEKVHQNLFCSVFAYVQFEKVTFGEFSSKFQNSNNKDGTTCIHPCFIMLLMAVSVNMFLKLNRYTEAAE